MTQEFTRSWHGLGRQTSLTLAASLRKQIGAHAALVGRSDVTQDEYLAARSASDRAESLAKYLADHAYGPEFARACGLTTYARELESATARNAARFMASYF